MQIRSFLRTKIIITSTFLFSTIGGCDNIHRQETETTHQTASKQSEPIVYHYRPVNAPNSHHQETKKTHQAASTRHGPIYRNEPVYVPDSHRRNDQSRTFGDKYGMERMARTKTTSVKNKSQRFSF